MARALKGKHAENLKGDKKLKKEATLKRMDDNKVKDTIRLRTAMSAKIEELKEEFDKVSSLVEDYKSKILELENSKISMQGAYKAISEMLK